MPYLTAYLSDQGEWRVIDDSASEPIETLAQPELLSQLRAVTPTQNIHAPTGEVMALRFALPDNTIVRMEPEDYTVLMAQKE